MELKVYTQNIYGFPNVLLAKYRLNHCLKYVVKSDFDVVFLQEVFLYSWLKYGLAANSYISDTYNIYYTKKRTHFQIEGGLVVLIKKHIILEDIQFNKFQQQGIITRPAQLVHYINNKGYLKIRVNYEGHTIHLINTHTSASFVKNKESLKTLNPQSLTLYLQLAQLISTLNNLTGEKVLLAGDLNLNLHSVIESMGKSIIQDVSNTLQGLWPKQTLLVPDAKAITHYSKKGESLIDFILASGLTGTSFDIVEQDRIQYLTFGFVASDHNGVVTNVVIV